MWFLRCRGLGTSKMQEKYILAKFDQNVHFLRYQMGAPWKSYAQIWSGFRPDLARKLHYLLVKITNNPPNLICIPPRASKSHRDSAQIRHKNHSNILIQFPPYLSDFACKFIFHSKCYQHRNFIGVPHRFECIQAKSGRGTAWKWICIPNNRFWAGLRPSLKTCRVCSEFGEGLSDTGWVPRNQSYSTICCLK